MLLTLFAIWQFIKLYIGVRLYKFVKLKYTSYKAATQ